jgi:glycosyltransferase involved in cell wall biosynthesis
MTFGFIGALMPHKGTHVAVEAFRGIDRNAARLLIWGSPEANPDYSARLREQAAHGAIEFRGRFDESDRDEILSSIDVLVVPSVGMESFGIVAREAITAGVPVIASRRGALEELEIDGVCGATVAPDDPGALEKWIQRLIDKPGILEEWRRSLPVQTRISQHAAKIEEIYWQILRVPG